MKKRSLANKRHNEKEPDFSKKGFRIKFSLGPGKTLLTLLCICILGFSLSADVAWLIGYQYTVYLLYIGVFSTALMVVMDISDLINYYKDRKKEKSESKETDKTEDTENLSDSESSSVN